MLKDGQIVEQGNHTELLARGGFFAAMWADQVSSTEDSGSSHKKDTLGGYTVDDDEGGSRLGTGELVLPSLPMVETPEVQAEEIAVDSDLQVPASLREAEESAVDAPVEFPAAEPTEETQIKEAAPTPVAFPSSDEQGPVAFPAADTPAAVTFPASEAKEEQAPVAFPAAADSPAPVAFAFPGSETSSQTNTPSIGGTQSPGVTFQNMPTPARSGTPDVDQDGKRRRTLSTQGIQRLARRISISGRRQGSSGSIPAAIFNTLKRDNSALSKDSSPKDGPKDAAKESAREDGSLVNAEASTGTPQRDSPSGSVASDINRTKTKKEKKKEKRKSMI